MPPFSEPTRFGTLPEARYIAVAMHIQDNAVSNSEVLTSQPSPVSLRRSSAERMPITAHMPAP